MSTVEPGRKPIEPEGNGDLSNGVFDINIDMEITKSEEKRSTNGTIEKHNECNSTEHIADEVASSSGISQISAEIDAKKEEGTKESDEKMSEKPVETEKKPDSTESELANEKMVEDEVTSSAEAIAAKPDVSIDEAVATKDEKDAVKVEEPELNVTPEKTDSVEKVKVESEQKSEAVVESSTDSEEKKVDEELKPVEKVIESEKPPTPKHARSTSDDEDGDVDSGSKNPCAKKIRLEMDDEVEKVEKPDPEPSIEPSIEPSVVAEVDLQKEAEILESISSEIDAQTENELLEDVVDAALAAEKDSISADIPITEKAVDTEVLKPAEEKPVADDSLKTNEPVAIPTTLDDFTPDEALNELVSSEILSVIPEQPAEEVKMSDEPTNITEPVAAADEMNVENPETTSTSEAESAMESAPIKADEEQMDVDESNSVDAMDL